MTDTFWSKVAVGGGDELDWAIRQYTELRAIARRAVKQENSDER